MQQLPSQTRPLSFDSFDPNDPFPALAIDEYSLEESQIHAEAVDRWLGLNTRVIEDKIAKRPGMGRDVQTWSGLPVQSLLTPYLEIRTLLEFLKPEPGSKLADLGAGYGRMAFVVGRHFPDVRFIGYELISERVQESLRCLARHSFPNVEMIVADLADPNFRPVEAQYYFLYDFGSRSAIEKSLQDLRRIARSRPITVIGRGRSSRDAIEREHPWLSQVIPPHHTRTYSVYRSA